MARRRTRRKSRNRSRRRKSRRKSKRKRKSRRRRKRKRKTRHRGGSKVKVNPLNNKVMEPPVSTNMNWNSPRNPSQMGGRKRRTKRRRRKQKGGSLLRAIGLGDVVQGYYSATDLANNTRNKWAGKKNTVSSNPIRQPRMMKVARSQYKIPNVPEYHRVSSAKAAKHMLKS
tara:strand:- start:688 stop:1200 length:513 start_codon:yes stop_codon:yes gene_type:complete